MRVRGRPVLLHERVMISRGEGFVFSRYLEIPPPWPPNPPSNVKIGSFDPLPIGVCEVPAVPCGAHNRRSCARSQPRLYPSQTFWLTKRLFFFFCFLSPLFVHLILLCSAPAPPLHFPCTPLSLRLAASRRILGQRQDGRKNSPSPIATPFPSIPLGWKTHKSENIG